MLLVTLLLSCGQPECLEGDITPGEVVVFFDDSITTEEEARAWATSAGFVSAGFIRTPSVMTITVPIGDECRIALDLADSGPPVTDANVNLIVHTE